MKNLGSTSSSSKVIDQLAEIIDSLSMETTNSVVQNNATNRCQRFSIRKHVADTRETNPKACNPLGENTDHIWEQLKGPLDVPDQAKYWRCRNCVRGIVPSSTPGLLCASVEHRTSGDATEGEGSKAPIEVINVDDSDEEEIQITSPLEELARVAILLQEMEANANHGQEFVTPRETQNAKRPGPLSANTDLNLRKRAKASGESSRTRRDKQKRIF